MQWGQLPILIPDINKEGYLLCSRWHCHGQSELLPTRSTLHHQNVKPFTLRVSTRQPLSATHRVVLNSPQVLPGKLYICRYSQRPVKTLNRSYCSLYESVTCVSHYSLSIVVSKGTSWVSHTGTFPDRSTVALQPLLLHTTSIVWKPSNNI